MSQHAPAERVQITTVERDQPGDQVRRDSAAVHRQGCPFACCDARTGPSPPVPQIQEQFEEVAKTFPQRRVSERIVVQTTDVPVPQILKEVAEVVKAVNTAPQDRISETTGEQIVDAPDEPFPPFQEEIYEVIKLPPTERILERTVEHIVVQVPVPQTLEEVVEVAKAVKNVPLERISEKIGEQVDDDIVPVDQPGDQACRDPQACGDATTGPSTVAQPGDQARRYSAEAVHRQGCRSAHCGTATGFTVAQPDDQARRDSTDTVLRPGCWRAYCDTATGPADSNCAEDGGSLARAIPACGDAATGPSDPDGGEAARAVQRQNCGRACDPAVDADTGPSASDCGEGGGSLALAVHRQIGGPPQERIWCIFEDACYDSKSLPQPWCCGRAGLVDQQACSGRPAARATHAARLSPALGTRSVVATAMKCSIRPGSQSDASLTMQDDGDGVRHCASDYVFHAYCGEHCSLFSLALPLAGFLVQLLHLIPTSLVGQTSARVLDCSGSHVKRALTCSATVHGVRVGTAVAADPQRYAVRRLARVGECGPGEDVFERPAGANA